MSFDRILHLALCACAAVPLLAQEPPDAPAEKPPAPTGAPQATGAPQETGAPQATGTEPATRAEPSSTRAAQPTAAARDVLPDAATWQSKIARDRRIAFTARTAADARALLDVADVPDERRAIAWVALGAAGSIGDRPRLESLARSEGAPAAKGIERRGAVLALGEMAASVEPLLFDLAAKGPPEIAECALLALLRSDRPSSRRRVEEIAHDPSDPATHAASDLLVFDADPESSAPTAATVLLLDLRWEAARAFGLVDGQSWPMLRVRELGLDPIFLREVVLRAAASVKRPGIKDHLLSELVTGSGPGRLRAAIQAMPREVYELVDSGLWAPKDLVEWTEIIDQVDELGLEPLTVELLERASEIEELHYRALAMLSRTDQASLVGRIDADLARLSREDRLWAIEAAGASGEPGWMKRLAPLAEDESADVRTAALVALARLGSKKSALDLRGIVADEEHADHAALIRSMCRTARDPLVSTILEDRLGTAREAEAIQIATALALDGRLTARIRVRTALGAEPSPRGAYAVRLVRALRRHATTEDLAVFQRLFPRPDEPELNIELATALTELGDPLILPLLRAALWRGDWAQSVLAGALITEIAGIHALRGELARPPSEASSNDVRRVGFAIGEWGGLIQVEGLARELRYNSGHPALQGALLGFLSARTQ